MKSLVRVRAVARRRRSLIAALSMSFALAVPLGGLGAGAAGAATPRPVGTYHGLGFDLCGVPTVAQLSAWNTASSPYKALNVYIGGLNAACPAKVSPSWVKSVTALGWGIIPTYVGLQAPQPECPCAGIVPSKAYSEGAAAAVDAVKLMAADGMGKGNPVYYDMEGYTRGKPNTPAVLTFLKAWTTKLHALGYISGVYAGAATGVVDLVSRYGTSYPEPDDLWIAEWNGLHTTNSSYVPAADWANHQRLHQFSGETNLTYGGVTLKGVDGDFCDGAVVSASTV